MAAEAVAVSKWQSIVAFVRDSYHEIRHKTTWPDVAQVRQASIAIIIFVLIIGLVITLLDTVLYNVFSKLLPSLFS
ncbi:MAG TPA: preprotein translocase subunit SecE [Terriglobia bacterium]|jgi:preprotein translocase SecE subunit|nr:preprotein translocase subunit SecE [Terriglobia bacterium]